MPLTEALKDENILYIKPFYKENKGDITIICTINGEYEIPYQIRTVIKKIAAHYYVDIASIRKAVSKHTNRKNLLVYPFSQNLILTPIKCRKPIAKDHAYGYINYIYYKNAVANGNHTQIIFTNDTKLECLQKIKSIKDKILLASVIKDEFFRDRILYGEDDDVKETIKKALYSFIKTI